MKTKTGGRRREKSFVAVDVFEFELDDDGDDFFLRLFFRLFFIFFPLLSTWLVDGCVCFCVRTCVYTCTLAFIARACASSPPVRRRFAFLNERQLDWWGYRNGCGSSTVSRGVQRRPFRRSWGIAWFGRRAASRRTAHPYFCCSLRGVHSRLNFVIAYTRVSALRVLLFFSRLRLYSAPSLGRCRRLSRRFVRLFLLFYTYVHVLFSFSLRRSFSLHYSSYSFPIPTRLV